ncbi:MAG: exodeoxyribonuclease VII small subunit [Chloroflexi bacterium]|nr:exodeoxyribonuclease VII small subunit [Chloroflexota bacterium]
MAEQLSFEQALARLEQTVKTLEAGNLSLEGAVALYEEGMRLARICRQHLDSAQLRISQIDAIPAVEPGNGQQDASP